MKTNRDISIKKSEIIKSLEDIPLKGVEGASIEKYMGHKSHPLYNAFIGYFERNINKYSPEEITPEKYAEVFHQTVKEIMSDRTKREKMSPGQLYKVHNFYDTLIQTITPKNDEKFYNSFTQEAIKEYDSKQDFFDMYEEMLRKVI